MRIDLLHFFGPSPVSPLQKSKTATRRSPTADSSPTTTQLFRYINMADYHFVYKDVDGASTEWDDLQRKLGNLPPKRPSFKPPSFTPQDESISRDKSWIKARTEEELDELEDDRCLDDDRFLEQYRQMRLAEMREASKILRFGSVIHISGSDFIREVSEAPPDVWVVVLLYKEGIPQCRVLMQCIEELAARYASTKFIKIISTDCIPNYPDCNLPTLLVYNNGAVKKNYVGTRSFGVRCTSEGVALALCQLGSVLSEGGTNDRSSEATIEGIRKRFIEKIVTENEEDDNSSD